MNKRKHIVAIFMTVILLAELAFTNSIQIVYASPKKVSITISHTTKIVTVGKSFKLKAKTVNFPKNKIKWSSTNTQVATVSEKGMVKTKKIGKTNIIASAGKKKVVCKLTVKKKKNNNISAKDNWDNWIVDCSTKEYYNEEPIVLSRGEKYNIKKMLPHCSDDEMKKHNCKLWMKSSSEAALTVDEDGIVTAVGPGKAAVLLTIIQYKDTARTQSDNVLVYGLYLQFVACPNENPSYIIQEVDPKVYGSIDFWKSVVPTDFLHNLENGGINSFIDFSINSQIETIVAPGNVYQYDYACSKMPIDILPDDYYGEESDQGTGLREVVDLNIILPSTAYIGVDYDVTCSHGFYEYKFDIEKQKEYIKAVKDSIVKYQNLVKDCTSDNEKLQIIADEMADEMEYGDPDVIENMNLWSEFVENKTVCLGYAYKEQMILNSVGILAVCAIGEIHGMDYVYIDGRWYGSDITWYDTGKNSAWILYTGEDLKKHTDEYTIYNHTLISEIAIYYPQI